VLSTTKFFIKLGNHITDHYYSSSTSVTLFGTGQGSGFFPHIWTMLSNELFYLYAKITQGFKVQNSFQHAASYLHITAYVDNVNTHHSFSPNLTANAVINQAKIPGQRWHYILHISGGKLSNTKCNYYLVMWDYATTGRIQVNTESHPSMTIQDNSGNPFHIVNKSIQESHKSLGYLQSMANPKSYQRSKITEISTQLIQVLNFLEMDF
jgi:hypothetical protein